MTTVQKTVAKDAIGVTFKFTVVEDGAALPLQSATIKRFIFRKPVSDVDLTVNASFYTDGSDGILKYVTVSGDLNEVGLWTAQAYLEVGVFKGNTDTTTFIVESNL
jgi:hypothetical protein